MAAERDIDAVLLAERDVIALADVVERKQLDHQVMHAIAAGLDQSETVMTRIDVEEIGAKRLLHVVAQLKAEQVDIERHHRVDVFHRQHGVSKPERAGAKTGNRTARKERRLVDLGTVKCLETIARGIAKRNQPLYAPVVGERAGLGGDLESGGFEPSRKRVERRSVCDLPSEEALA